MTSADDYRETMSTEGAAIKGNTRTFNANRYDAVGALEGYEDLKDEARAIKADAIDRLPELLETLETAVESNGGSTYLAPDAEAATEYIQDVVAAHSSGTVVKSKSMTTEEIELNRALDTAEVEVVETDLGEWVVQLAEDDPSHLVAPAIHFTRAEIAALFEDRFDQEEPLESATELTRFARDRLAEEIRAADVGITGANMIAAESGTMMLVTSEGNARRVIDGTAVHIAVAGIEKVIPSVSSFEPFIQLLARSATGQALTSYVSLLTPPVDTPVVDFDDATTPLSQCGTDREFHLVLVDNGRWSMRDDPDLRETLYCIRCGACANTCANFQSVGGHEFGGETYTGGIATGWEAGIEGLDVAGEFNDLCTGCSRCVDACPVQIDIPWINTVVRDRRNRDRDVPIDALVDGLTPQTDDAGVSMQQRFFSHFPSVARLGAATAPVSNWMADREVTRLLLQALVGIDPRRSLPRFQRHTFREWARTAQLARPEADRSVILYPDAYTDYILVDRGIATARALAALGVDVHVPAIPASGRAPLSQGRIGMARDCAEDVAEALTPHLAAGRDLVVIEPSDLAIFRRDYDRLLDPELADRIASRATDPFEYIESILDAGADPTVLAHGDGARVAYHPHCQQRTVGASTPTISVLEHLGYDVDASTAECCGMAGSFGYKSEFFEVSMDVGETLRTELAAAGPADQYVSASGASCLEQLQALLDHDVLHPVQLIAPPESAPTTEYT